VATSAGGEHIVLPDAVLRAFLEHRLDRTNSWFFELESRHLLADGNDSTHCELLAAQYRTRQSRLPDFTALHIFVITLRCDNSCQYCQVSRVSEDKVAFDMSEETANRAIDLMFRSPSPVLKIEFQGGESLLNYPLLKHIVLRTNARAANRHVEFVVATNLANLSDEMLGFFAEHRVFVSTSLDGPAALHNRNRPRPSGDAYERTIKGIQLCRERLGHDSVSALMTCTAESLRQPEAIIDEYVAQGFREIFLRSISPYGFATKTAAKIGYETEQFIDFYKRGLAHILSYNRRGVSIREVYTSILLRRMLTSFPTGYVDLQSPAGVGLSVLVYNYDGDVYASDESRMLAEMGDKSFRLGNVHRDSWEDVFRENQLLTVLHNTMTEGIPGCCDCAFQPYCGSDPVRHHTTQGDSVGHRPTSSFCRRNMELFRHLVRLMEDDPRAAGVLRGWVR
jgi:His-Xaa-Ser system radical SAM maturase HxsB